MTAKCREVELLIDREAHGWNQAERLRVEQHLEGCGGCREALAVARLVRDTLQNASHELSEAARGRAIGRALSNAANRPHASERPRRAHVMWALAGMAAAAAVVLIMLSMSTNPELANRAPTAGPPKSAAVTAPPKEASVKTPAPALAWIEANGSERHAFAHAQVELETATRVRFDAAERALFLERGRVAVDVDASKGQSFSVVTQHFRVVVLGTRFSVTPDSVVVTHGRVQVLGLDGSVLASALAAGATFSYGSEAPAPAAVHAAPVPAKVWLSRAREALTQNQTQRARELVARAEESTPQRSERAEAFTLRAEAALLDRDPKAALGFYLSVFERFADLRAGENAAFAAAQLSARADPRREQLLLNRYLARYPRGRFADESKLRLEKLRSK
jgi:ferric-dicitrate binding protein FerR (iron transport regulator)